ncbi:MAG: DUF72 domain-containing protein [Desulfobacteraceae bacterium]
MRKEETEGLDRFQFRDLHPSVFMGTASDRYAGWIGQIYSEERYRGKTTSRSKKVGGKSLKEEVLPVESVEEYFQHFSVLELDFTFYRPLLDKDSQPTQNHHVLQTYRRHLREQDRLILKVPQLVFAKRLWRGGKFVENPDYLKPDIFVNQFYVPATELLGPRLKGFIFEQEYQPKKARIPLAECAEELDQFFAVIPKDSRYHIELRTEPFLSEPYFQVLERYGIGQVLSHWTWLPPLRRQLSKSKDKFLNADKQCIVRLMTPLRVRYEEAYLKAYPFDKLIDGMMSHHMVEETAEIMSTAIREGVGVNVIINNRAGGNAPLIAQKVSEKFLEKHPKEE